MKDEPRKQDGLVRDKRGAAMVEFLLAIIPLCTMFLTFCQLALVFTAHLVTQHAASSAARAAAVITNDPVNPGKHGTDEDVTRAAKIAMGPWFITQSILLDEATPTDNSSEEDPAGMVTVTVKARYQCVVPLGQYLCQGGEVGRRDTALVATASFPHQGAKYKISDCEKEAQGDLGNSGGGGGLGGGDVDLPAPVGPNASSSGATPTP